MHVHMMRLGSHSSLRATAHLWSPQMAPLASDGRSSVDAHPARLRRALPARFHSTSSAVSQLNNFSSQCTLTELLDLDVPARSWTTTTVLLPLLISLFVVFPSQHQQTQTTPRRPVTRASATKSLAPPSALTFAIIRFALTYYLHRLSPTAGPPIGWVSELGRQPGASEPCTDHSLLRQRWDILHRFGDLQLWTASVAGAFAVYEQLAVA